MTTTTPTTLDTLTDCPTPETLLAAILAHGFDAVVATLRVNDGLIDLNRFDFEGLIRRSDVEISFDSPSWEEIDGGIYAAVVVEVSAHGCVLGTVHVPLTVERCGGGAASIGYEGGSGLEKVSGLLAMLGDARDCARAVEAVACFGSVPGEDEDEDGDFFLVEGDRDGEVAHPLKVMSRHSSSVGAAMASMGSRDSLILIGTVEVETNTCRTTHGGQRTRHRARPVLPRTSTTQRKNTMTPTTMNEILDQAIQACRQEAIKAGPFDGEWVLTEADCLYISEQLEEAGLLVVIENVRSEASIRRAVEEHDVYEHNKEYDTK